ncbi:beta-glucosidase 10 [Spinacia oleracea]|uniref:Beta-glucosidase 10 n=1 Tax=Spinacia oleracea TaxID=3562 RepID=A0A9R0HWM6_SPIOL|nr:beta-glucosidase 10-like [Spinacia oleracea]
MKKSSFNVYHHLLLYSSLLIWAADLVGVGAKIYNRNDFPTDFIFGSGTSSYQVEGAAFEDGRKASVFDTFAHSWKPLEGRHGDVTSDGYHNYKKDVELMAETGLDAYRFSISWSRLIPDGRGIVNPKGLEYYNNLIDELISHGIQPHATLMHLDTPQVLEDEYGGFLSARIIEDFTAYADVCFKEFGDRVVYWTTINEPNIFALGGYDNGASPPGRCSYPFGILNCTKGNSTTEPYLAAHNMLLAHASAAKLYKQRYQGKQHGIIGFSFYAYHFIPSTDSTKDKIATQRAHEFFIGWFMHPLMYGDYPRIMKKNVGYRLPIFTKRQSDLVKGSLDFIGVNYYTAILVTHRDLSPEPRDYVADMGTKWIYYNYTSDSPMEVTTFPVIPWALQGFLEYFKNVYNNPPIYIYENGQMTEHDTIVDDPSRVEYLQAHIGGLLDAVRNGSNTKGYFVWSFLDLFEMLYGYKYSFGLYYVDFNDPNRTRYAKLSQRWYSGFLKGETVTTDDEGNQPQNISTTIRTITDSDDKVSTSGV